MVLTAVMVDHYDSFTHNVLDWLYGAKDFKSIRVIEYDDQSAMQDLAHSSTTDLIILSPGPHAPKNAESTLNLTCTTMYKIPLLGICLGHQIIGASLGFDIAPLSSPLHGRKIDVDIKNYAGLYRGFNNSSFKAGVYNSLHLVGEPDAENFKDWTISSRDRNGQILSLEYHKNGRAPVATMQFHPDSFLTDKKDMLLSNIVREVRQYKRLKETTCRTQD